ncbi:hypothetical protein [Pseudomonas syringae]|uniref:hypothetical protein n=1 Tax=Pseudomonas syringae TaxID=317 RepID=UPI0008EC67E1|nr:hypothetical protein [Pseudomonas syringae]MCK0551037.1 hypothetical protein [Pseudomonas syringae pv. aptata]SFO92122.1 hypothetical protein SAMN05444063_12887 [Pseudomonas syringae]
MTEEEMRQALFGSGKPTGPLAIPQAQPPAVTKEPVPSEVRRKTIKNFVPGLIVTLRVGVTTCNRNGVDLQSSRFSTGIDCVYPSQQTGIICE